jgi:cellulose biosynthesis protein BcsQ
MALANVGVLMASEGHRVLLVDWDLEAPGLEVYFERATGLVGNPSETCGVVDLLQSHTSGSPLPWDKCLLRAEFFGHSLDILTSGRRTDDYQRRVQGLDWERLFREHRIGNYINSLRDEWRERYDFVLVDSRTGITDIGDICTVILPDVLVFLFVTNHQSVDGTRDVMARAVKARAKMPVNRSKLLAVPVPARDERDREYDKSVEWQGIFAEEFSDLYREWLPKEVSPADALNRLFIPYVASWSFGEHIPVVESERERADPTSLGAAYARLATLLSNRLDWSAIEGRASPADVVGARVELHKAREEAAQSDLKLEQLLTQTQARRRRGALAFVLLALLFVCIVALLLWQNEKNKASEKETADRISYATLSLLDLGFSWNAEEKKLEATTARARKLTSLIPLADFVYALMPRTFVLRNSTALRSAVGLDRFILLRNLDLSGCTSLLTIDGVTGLELVQNIDLTGCTSLANIDALEGFKNLETLNLSNCSALPDVDILSKLTSLKRLDLSGCKLLQTDALQKLRSALPKTEIIFPDGSETKQ